MINIQNVDIKNIDIQNVQSKWSTNQILPLGNPLS